MWLITVIFKTKHFFNIYSELSWGFYVWEYGIYKSYYICQPLKFCKNKSLLFLNDISLSESSI